MSKAPVPEPAASSANTPADNLTTTALGSENTDTETIKSVTIDLEKYADFLKNPVLVVLIACLGVFGLNIAVSNWWWLVCGQAAALILIVTWEIYAVSKQPKTNKKQRNILYWGFGQKRYKARHHSTYISVVVFILFILAIDYSQYWKQSSAQEDQSKAEAKQKLLIKEVAIAALQESDQNGKKLNFNILASREPSLINQKKEEIQNEFTDTAFISLEPVASEHIHDKRFYNGINELVDYYSNKYIDEWHYIKDYQDGEISDDATRGCALTITKRRHNITPADQERLRSGKLDNKERDELTQWKDGFAEVWRFEKVSKSDWRVTQFSGGFPKGNSKKREEQFTEARQKYDDIKKHINDKNAWEQDYEKDRQHYQEIQASDEHSVLDKP